MQSALHPYATAGVAIVGASLIAVTPVTAPLPDIPTIRDVALTAGGGVADLLNPWIEQYNEAANNASVLANNFYLAPGVGSQQFHLDINNFLGQIWNDPSSTPDQLSDLQDNIKAALSSFTLLNVDTDTLGTTAGFTLGGDHALIATLLPGFLPASVNAEQVSTILDFLSSPLSGILWGLLGPFVAPWVALGNSIGDGDGISAILANTVGAFFNGATLNLDKLTDSINSSGVLPPPIEFHHLSLAFGGLLSTGSVTEAPWTVVTNSVSGGDDDTFTVPVVGGSLFNSVGLDLIGVPVLGNLNLEAEPLGPIGALQGTSELMGFLLGSEWGVEGSCSGKGCTPPVVPAFPPGTGIHYPTIPTLAADDPAGAAADTGVWSQLTDVFTNWQWSDVL